MRRDAEVLQAGLGRLADVVGGKHVVERVARDARPFAVLRRDLRRDDELLVAMAGEHLAEQLLALAVAVGERGVEERAAERDRPLERRERLASSDPDQPPMPHRPYPTSETGQPSRPKGRNFMGSSLTGREEHMRFPGSRFPVQGSRVAKVPRFQGSKVPGVPGFDGSEQIESGIRNPEPGTSNLTLPRSVPQPLTGADTARRRSRRRRRSTDGRSRSGHCPPRVQPRLRRSPAAPPPVEYRRCGWPGPGVCGTLAPIRDRVAATTPLPLRNIRR